MNDAALFLETVCMGSNEWERVGGRTGEDGQTIASEDSLKETKKKKKNSVPATYRGDVLLYRASSCNIFKVHLIVQLDRTRKRR